MTSQKPKPLFPGEITPIQLPVLSIEEPAQRVMPTPVPVVIPLRTVKGGVVYVAQLARSLPISILYEIVVSEEKIRKYDMGIGVEYEVSPPTLFASEDVSIKSIYEAILIAATGIKYDGKCAVDKLSVVSNKYDGRCTTNIT